MGKKETSQAYQNQYYLERTSQNKILYRDILSQPYENKDSPVRSKSPCKTTDDVLLADNKPMRGFFMITTIQPQNTYKKLMNACSDKLLIRDNCNMLNSYFTVVKHDLFDCKTAVSIKLLPQQETIKE